jgi:type IV secretion system protein VirB10
VSANLGRGAAPLRPRAWLRTTAQKRAALFVAGAGIIGAAVWVGAGVTPQKRTEPPEDAGSKMIAQVVPPPPLSAEPPPIKSVAAAAPMLPPLVPPPPSISTVVPHGGSQAPAPLESFFARGPAGEHVAPSDPSGEGSTGGPTRVAFKAAALPGAKAGPAIDLTYMMMPQFIGCALENAIDSTLPGPIICHAVRDVLSPRGVVLMRAGTTITGEYKNNLRQGQNRIFAMSATAYTPEGIPVPLDGPMADGLRRAGISGQVDNHYLERFGAGVLMMLTEGGFGLGQAALSQNSAYLNIGSGYGAEDVATQILQSQINIPPTISAPPGAIVTIITRYPIDFSDALHVKPREEP